MTATENPRSPGSTPNKSLTHRATPIPRHSAGDLSATLSQISAINSCQLVHLDSRSERPVLGTNLEAGSGTPFVPRLPKSCATAWKFHLPFHQKTPAIPPIPPNP